MRPRKDTRHDLLEDIFAPEAGNRGATENDILRLVQAARIERQRRRQTLAGAAAIVSAVACGFALWPKESRIEQSPITVVDSPAPKPTPVAAAAPAPSITPPPVERVDDKGMLAMLGDRPAALVRWPDRHSPISSCFGRS